MAAAADNSFVLRGDRFIQARAKIVCKLAVRYKNLSYDSFVMMQS